MRIVHTASTFCLSRLALAAAGAAHAQDAEVVGVAADLLQGGLHGRLRGPGVHVQVEEVLAVAGGPARVIPRRQLCDILQPRAQELLELVRDYEALDQDEKTINVHVSHLREKLEDDPVDPTFILTIRGAGYAFAER